MLDFGVMYLFIKLVFFFSLVRSFIKYEPLKDHVLFLSILYTAGVAVLSYVFILAPQRGVNWSTWRFFLGQTLFLTVVYFWLLKRFGEGLFFVVLLAAGIGLVLFNGWVPR